MRGGLIIPRGGFHVKDVTHKVCGMETRFHLLRTWLLFADYRERISMIDPSGSMYAWIKSIAPR